MSLKNDFRNVHDRFEAWWAGSSLGDRPIVICRDLYRPDASPRPADGRPRCQRELDPQWQLANARRKLRARHFAAETLPVLNVEFANSLCIPAVFAGADLEYGDDTTWIRPMRDVYERELPDFSPGHPTFQALIAAIRLLAAELGGQSLLTAPSLLDGLTTLSMLRGPEQLCLDLIERPQDVKRVAAHLDRVAMDAHAAFYKTLRELGHAQTITWADVYAPGSCEMTQCDFSVNISPAMFDEFVLPQLRIVSEHFDRTCYHMDGAEQYRFIDRFCSISRLQSIQWQPGEMNRRPLKYIDYLRDIRRRGRAIWVQCFDPQTAIDVTRQLGPDGLMLYLRGIKEIDELNRLVEQLEASGW